MPSFASQCYRPSLPTSLTARVHYGRARQQPDRLCYTDSSPRAETGRSLILQTSGPVCGRGTRRVLLLISVGSALGETKFDLIPINLDALAGAGRIIDSRIQGKLTGKRQEVAGFLNKDTALGIILDFDSRLPVTSWYFNRLGIRRPTVAARTSAVTGTASWVTRITAPPRHSTAFAGRRRRVQSISARLTRQTTRAAVRSRPTPTRTARSSSGFLTSPQMAQHNMRSAGTQEEWWISAHRQMVVPSLVRLA